VEQQITIRNTIELLTYILMGEAYVQSYKKESPAIAGLFNE
jgi:hypothetical protein